jgi:hypothetical protein
MVIGRALGSPLHNIFFLTALAAKLAHAVQSRARACAAGPDLSPNANAKRAGLAMYIDPFTDPNIQKLFCGCGVNIAG